MQTCENDKSDHQMRNKYFQFQRNEQSEIVSELHQCYWGGLSEVWVKTKITLWFTHIQEGWQEFSRKLATPKIYFEAVTFPAAALRGSPHSSHNQVLLWDEQACLLLEGERARCWKNQGCGPGDWGTWPSGLGLKTEECPSNFKKAPCYAAIGATPPKRISHTSGQSNLRFVSF